MEFLGGLEFRHPWFLALALLAPLAFVLARRQQGRVRFSALSILPQADHSLRARLERLPDLLVSVAVLALALAAAGPRVGDKNSRIKKEGIAIMLAVDVSGSMRALDLSTKKDERTRLDAVKKVFEKFVVGGGSLGGRSDDAVGIVRFARYADTACPLTLDHDNLVSLARNLEIVADKNEDGTAIGDGLGLAVERLRESKARSKVVILLTDGVNNSGQEDPLAAAELAKTQDMKVYAIGAGTTGTAPVRVQDPFTGESVLRPMAVEIDEKTLRAIAEKTGGQYFRATDAEGLEKVYEAIDQLERTEFEENQFRKFDEYFPPFVYFGLALACLGLFLRATLLRRLP